MVNVHVPATSRRHGFGCPTWILGLFLTISLVTSASFWGTAAASAANSDASYNGDIALIRVRGSGDVRATEGPLNRRGQEGNSNWSGYLDPSQPLGMQATLDAASKAFRRRALEAGKSVNEYDLAYPAASTGQILSGDLVLSPQGPFVSSDYLDSLYEGNENQKTILTLEARCSTG
jgi:hypothetical protein